MPSDGWFKDYPYFCTLVLEASTFKLFATECYRYADISRPIQFNSAPQVDYNETLSDTGGYLPAEVSAFLSVLTSTAMQKLQSLHNSIPLDRRILTHPVQMQSDLRLTSYPYLCTLVPPATTFKLLATECRTLILSRLALINIFLL